jgi:hypothetical protein
MAPRERTLSTPPSVEATEVVAAFHHLQCDGTKRASQLRYPFDGPACICGVDPDQPESREGVRHDAEHEFTTSRRSYSPGRPPLGVPDFTDHERRGRPPRGYFSARTLGSAPIVMMEPTEYRNDPGSP